MHDLLHTYLRHWPENDRLATFAAFIAQHHGPALFDRHNFNGHITASALIVHAHTRQLLMIHHLRLDRWLQPGGHVDPRETPLVAAVREAVEETGISAARLQRIITHTADLPIDIDSHPIPAHAGRGEPAHTHHDFRYLFTYAGDDQLAPQLAEVHAVSWQPLDTVATLPGFAPLVGKMRQFL